MPEIVSTSAAACEPTAFWRDVRYECPGQAAGQGPESLEDSGGVHVGGCANQVVSPLAAAQNSLLSRRPSKTRVLRNLCTQDTDYGMLRERCSFHCTAVSVGIVAMACSQELAHSIHYSLRRTWAQGNGVP